MAINGGLAPTYEARLRNSALATLANGTGPARRYSLLAA
jgi:hypothetical protein